MVNVTELLSALRLGKELASTTFPINMKVVEYKLGNEKYKAFISDNGEYYHTVTEFGQLLNDSPISPSNEEEMLEIFKALGLNLVEGEDGELVYSKGDYSYTISANREVLTHDIDGVICSIHHPTGLFKIVKRNGNVTTSEIGEDFNVGDIYIAIIKHLKDLEGQA